MSFKTFWNWLKNLFARFRVRAGLDLFLERYLQHAVVILLDLATVNSGKKFDLWKDQAVAVLKEQLQKDQVEIKDNWIQIVLALAFESLKDRGKA